MTVEGAAAAVAAAVGGVRANFLGPVRDVVAGTGVGHLSFLLSSSSSSLRSPLSSDRTRSFLAGVDDDDDNITVVIMIFSTQTRGNYTEWRFVETAEIFREFRRTQSRLSTRRTRRDVS